MRFVFAILLVSLTAHAASPPVAALMAIHERYKDIAKRGGWGTIAPGPDLKRGDGGRRVIQLRKRLNLTGELKRPNRPGHIYKFDDETERAVKTFQNNHSLIATGVVDQETWTALNVSVGARLATISANLERWKWMPDDLGSRYVMVDIPGFSARLYENGKPALTMRAIVGETGMETPVFHSRISQIVFNPTWDIPHDIAVEEALPELQRDAAHAKDNHVEVFDTAGGKRRLVDAEKIDWTKVTQKNFHYALRQSPGLHNPLGEMKFLFPNAYSVFLHGTTEPGMFEASNRMLSHGCVRVEKPLELAARLLNQKPEKLKEIIDKKKTRGFNVPRPVPVYIGYWTAWAEGGTVQFRPDVYGWDEWDGKVLAELIRARGVQPAE